MTRYGVVRYNCPNYFLKSSDKKDVHSTHITRATNKYKRHKFKSQGIATLLSRPRLEN